MAGIRRYVVSIVLVFLVTGGLLGVSFGLGLKPRLGLDLRGGLSVILTAPPGTRTDVLEQTVEILRNRVDRAGVAEPEITREGSDNILIQLPGIDDPDRLLELIGRTAQLQFRQVRQIVGPGAPEYELLEVSETDDTASEVILLDPDGTKHQLAPATLTGEAVRDASAVVDPVSGGWHVEVRFRREGARQWQEFTGQLACIFGPERHVAIVLDGQVESAPQVSEEVACNEGIGGGTTVITGQFTEGEAKDLALVLTTGALPVELEQSDVRTVSPTLGSESLRAGLIAGALGLLLVMLYALVYYRSLGLQTWLGLLVFAGILYGLIVVLGELIGWSLTLAGIAGLIVAIGIAVDSYIVFFERVKEEVQTGKTLRSSMDRGFAQAWKTVRAANLVTIMAAIVLYLLAVGPVRGFALVLGMATVLDLLLFAALTWPLAALLARTHFFAEGRFIGMRRALEGAGARGRLIRKIYRSDFNVEFVGRRRVWLIASGVLLTVSALALIPGVRGLEFGIDFRGGAIYRAPVGPDVGVPELESAVREVAPGEIVAQVLEDPTTGRRQAQVQTPELEPGSHEAIRGALAGVAGVALGEIDFESVGEKWGQQITVKAVRGLAIFLVLAIIYISLRLEPKMALAGLAALFHDLLITAGVYAIVGFQVSPASVIALLTILGYSLYDTVVVFDKLRENAAEPANARKSFAEICNMSMNQVLMRSVNTSLTTLLPVGSLLFVGSALLGAETLKDLALALFIGIAAGTYSSIFVAMPLLSLWKEREPKYASLRSRMVGEAALARGRVEGGREDEEEEEALEADEGEVVGAEARRGSAPPAPRGSRVQPPRKSRRQRKKRRR